MIFSRKNDQLNFFLIFLFLGGLVLEAESQTGWSGPTHWAPGSTPPVVGHTIQYHNAVPDLAQIRACAGMHNVLNLEFRFTDIDLATCALGPLNTEYTAGSNYMITFSVTDPAATFSSGLNSQTVMVQAKYPQAPLPTGGGSMPPHGVTGTWYVYRSEMVELTISPAWTGNPIQISVRIVDNPAPLPPGDTGNAKDPDYFNPSEWTVYPVTTGGPPTFITRIPPPLPTDWTSVFPGGGQTFTYLANPPPAPNSYGLLTIREQFLPPLAGSIFTMADIIGSFATTWGLTTPDQVADFVFAKPIPNALGINAANVFTDTHGSYALNMSMNLNNIFTPPAIISNNVGYTLQQIYSCCGSIIASPVIQRRIIVTG